MKRMDIGAVPVVEDRTGMRLVGGVALADIGRDVGPEEPGEVVRVLETSRSRPRTSPRRHAADAAG